MRRFVKTGIRSCQAAGRRSFSALVLAEHNNSTLADGTKSAVTAAAHFGDVIVLVAGSDCNAVAEEAASLSGVTKVLRADDPIYARSIAENVTPLVVQVSKDIGATHIVSSDGSAGKNTMPRVAITLDVAQISDVLKIHSDSEFDRPMYAGNVIATVESSDAVKVLTVRSTCFPGAEAGGSAPIEDVSTVSVEEKTKFVQEMAAGGDGPSLTAASKVVSGGRGMQSGDNFPILYELAEALNDCAVGASRAAVDAGFCSNAMQVGQTGKVVAPNLYVACGISGAIQHLAGMKDSKTIVAINKDEEAPIHAIADYGLVADLFDAVPELTQKLKS